MNKLVVHSRAFLSDVIAHAPSPQASVSRVHGIHTAVSLFMDVICHGRNGPCAQNTCYAWPFISSQGLD